MLLLCVRLLSVTLMDVHDSVEGRNQSRKCLGEVYNDLDFLPGERKVLVIPAEISDIFRSKKRVPRAFPNLTRTGHTYINESIYNVLLLYDYPNKKSFLVCVTTIFMNFCTFF